MAGFQQNRIINKKRRAIVPGKRLSEADFRRAFLHQQGKIQNRNEMHQKTKSSAIIIQEKYVKILSDRLLPEKWNGRRQLWNISDYKELIMADIMIERCNKLSTAVLADACLHLGIQIRCAPSELQAISNTMHCAGRVRPTHHTGSVDIFLEALEYSDPGDVLVVDDGGRRDRACVGDLIAHEVQLAGLSGIVLWGCHRDTRQLVDIGLPFFSIGRHPSSPQSLDRRTHDALEWARVGDWIVTYEDVAVGDGDGVIFLPFNRLTTIVPFAEALQEKERRQAAIMRYGTSLREQFYFEDYMEEHSKDPSYDFHKHLNKIGGAIE